MGSNDQIVFHWIPKYMNCYKLTNLVSFLEKRGYFPKNSWTLQQLKLLGTIFSSGLIKVSTSGSGTTLFNRIHSLLFGSAHGFYSKKNRISTD